MDWAYTRDTDSKEGRPQDQPETPFIGLHGPVYITREHFRACLRDAKRVSIVAETGVDVVGPLERLALVLLQSGGNIARAQDHFGSGRSERDDEPIARAGESTTSREG